MANLKVVLLWYCKTEKGWRRFPAVVGGNGRIRAGYALVEGQPRHYPNGHYELRMYDGSKPFYKNAGTNPADALAARNREQKLLAAKEAAAEAGTKIVVEDSRTSLRQALDSFVLAAEDRGSIEAASEYRRIGTAFLDATSKRYADQIVDEDIVRFMRDLRTSGKADRTVANQHRLLKAFLRYAGVDVSVSMKAAPRVEKKLPEVYTAEQMGTFFASLKSTYEYVCFELLLKTGLREQEAQYLYWTDISIGDNSLTLHSKPEFGFRIKDKEERSVPITDDLLASLAKLRTERPRSRLVLGTQADLPNRKLLRLLKRKVRQAGLNCGVCASCLSREECEGWYLHKFRSTYCTQLLRSGLDLRTVQHFMGHSDMESTMRYLRPQENRRTQDTLNAIKWEL